MKKIKIYDKKTGKPVEIRRYTKEDCQTRGGWSCYCEWDEIYIDGRCVATIDEEHGEIYLPENPNGWKDRVYAGRCIPVVIKDINELFVEVEIQNKKKTIWKCWYKPLPVKIHRKAV